MDRKYLTLADGATGLKNKEVLEVGGCVAAEEIAPFSPKSWTSIDINNKRVQAVTSAADSAPFTHSACLMDACNMDLADNTFDRVYSVNCFEHINGLKSALSEMYRVLKPGGLLFTVFGPIWSSPVGHHTYVETENGVIHFNDHIFPDWQHLILSEESFTDSLKDKFSDDIRNQIAEYVYESDDLNRLVDGEYYDLISASGFTPILILKNKKGNKLSSSELNELRSKYKGIVDPRTTEILLVLRKGRFSLAAAVSAVVGLALAAFKLKISKN